MADWTRLSRREFDKAILTLGAGTVAGCATYRPACPADAHGGDPFEGYEFRYLSKPQAITIAAAAEIMIAECPPVISAAEVAKRADQFLDRIRSVSTKKMKLALIVIEDFGGLLSTVNLKKFSAEPLESRRAILDKFVRASGQERDVTRVIKMLTVFPYYTHPEVRRSIGFVDFERRARFSPLPRYTDRLVHREPVDFG